MVNDNFNFFNPKAGLNFEINTNNALYARANHEPNRTDYENGSPIPEKLNDFELGLRHAGEKVKFNANFIIYKDQLILTGELDDVGAPKNSGDSYRFGLELDAYCDHG
jgi:iron complex outermembrane receptor protein